MVGCFPGPGHVSAHVRGCTRARWPAPCCSRTADAPAPANTAPSMLCYQLVDSGHTDKSEQVMDSVCLCLTFRRGRWAAAASCRLSSPSLERKRRSASGISTARKDKNQHVKRDVKAERGTTGCDDLPLLSESLQSTLLWKEWSGPSMAGGGGVRASDFSPDERGARSREGMCYSAAALRHISGPCRWSIIMALHRRRRPSSSHCTSRLSRCVDTHRSCMRGPG